MAFLMPSCLAAWLRSGCPGDRQESPDAQIGRDVVERTVFVLVLFAEPGSVDRAENLSRDRRADSVAGQ
jgi:hypothetical protein